MPPKTQSILLAGVATGVIASLLSFVPVAGGCLSCLAYMGAGMLAIWHYTHTYNLTLLGGPGTGMGALAGLCAGAVATVLDLLFRFAGVRPGIQTSIQRDLENSDMDPAQMDQVMQFVSSQGFVIGIIIFGLVVALIIGAVGGAAGAAMFKKGEPPVGSSPDAF